MADHVDRHTLPSYKDIVMIFYNSPEYIRTQVEKDLREQERKAVSETCANAARMILAQNISDLAKICGRR